MESGDLESDPNYEHESDPNYEPESEEPGNEEEELEKEEEKQSCMENGKRYECNFEGCKATFNRPSRLENHMNLHKNKVGTSHKHIFFNFSIYSIRTLHSTSNLLLL